MKQNSPIIKIKNLTKVFNRIHVVDDLSVNFLAGERIALIGQNGAGKTTLIRCILGHYVYDGDVSVLGMNPRLHRKNVLKRVGFIPQLPPPLRLTVKELLEFFSRLTKTKKDAFIEVADSLGLSVKEHWTKPFFKLSGGMKQKLLISLALGRDIDILIMDEPTANLDPKAREKFIELLSRFNKKTLMILSSHRISEIENLISRVVEMDYGRAALDKILIKI
ncbi:MAG: hypothetical protein B6244_03615 [Candidatus Cloacimonetes bacterium 4572_55]|nr:MAG: hypothetical protein B6244_03615 [Candidatus Cloacimonetes bacterium 4572_55]